MNKIFSIFTLLFIINCLKAMEKPEELKGTKRKLTFLELEEFLFHDNFPCPVALNEKTVHEFLSTTEEIHQQATGLPPLQNQKSEPNKPLIKRFKCAYGFCRKSFRHYHKLLEHINLHHNNIRTFVCSYANCGVTFERDPDKSAHEKIHNPLIKCKICKKQLEHDNFKKHVLTEHPYTNHYQKNAFKKYFLCSSDNCPLFYSSQAFLYEHKKACIHITTKILP